MAKTILTPKQHQFLELASKDKQITKLFYLTGGTALAEFHLKHRLSEDLDFFTYEQEVEPKTVEPDIIKSNMQQATISTHRTLQEIISRLDRLSEEVKLIRDTLSQAEPPYGSEAWWKWSDAKALEDVKKGNYKSFKSAKEAIEWLNS